VKLEAHGIAVSLPPGWSGRVFHRPGSGATLHAADFPLVLSDGEFGDASTGHMRPGASFLALVEYLPGAGLEPGEGLFAPHRIKLPLDPTAFGTSRLAHARSHQVGAQQFFTRGGRPFCLYVVLAGDARQRRRQLPVLDRLLGTLNVTPSAGGVPT
jgi:hypothetical protein